MTIFLFLILCPLIINGGVPKESFHYCSVLKEAFLDISSSKCAFPSRKKSQLMILRSGLYEGAHTFFDKLLFLYELQNPLIE